MAKKHKTNTKQLYCVSGRYYYTKLDTALKSAFNELMERVKEPCGWSIRLVPKKDGYSYQATNDSCYRKNNYFGCIKSRAVKIRIINADNSPINYTGS